MKTPFHKLSELQIVQNNTEDGMHVSWLLYVPYKYKDSWNFLPLHGKCLLQKMVSVLQQKFHASTLLKTVDVFPISIRQAP